MREKLNPLEVGIKNIDNFKQNKPILIAQDMKELFGVPTEDTLKILLARGVLKWLGVREQLIGYKDELRKELTKTMEESREAKKKGDWNRHQQLKGKIKTLTEVRKSLRKMCHMPRWSLPFKDRYSLWFMCGLTRDEVQKHGHPWGEE